MYSYLTLTDGSGEIEEAQRVYSSKPLDSSRVRANAVGAAAVAAAQFLNQASVVYAVKDALDNIAAEADGAIRSWADVNEYDHCYDPSQVGALIHILLTRPLNWPDPRPISFQTLFVAACDLDPVTALNKYLATPSAFPGPPEGTEQLWKFLWRTLD